MKTKGNNYLVAQTRDSGNYGVWDNGSSWKPSVDNFLAAFLSPLSSRLPTLSPLGTNGRRWSVLEIGLINVAALDAPLTVLAQQKPNRRRGGGEEEERKKGDLFIAAKKSRIVSRCVIALYSLRRIGQC